MAVCGAERGHPGIVLRFRSCEPSPSASRASSSSPSREPPNSPPRLLGPGGLCHCQRRGLLPPSLLALLLLLSSHRASCALSQVTNRPLQVTPVDAPIGTLAHRAPQRRRAVARWTANGAVTGGDPPLVPFDENQACPSSTPSRKRMTVVIYVR